MTVKQLSRLAALVALFAGAACTEAIAPCNPDLEDQEQSCRFTPDEVE